MSVLVLKESLFNGVTTGTVSTSDINSDSIIETDNDKYILEPEKYFRFRMQFNVRLFELDYDAYPNTKIYPLDLEELYGNISKTISAIRLFRKQGDTPAFFMGIPFWNTDDYSYNIRNYEPSPDNPHFSFPLPKKVDLEERVDGYIEEMWEEWEEAEQEANEEGGTFTRYNPLVMSFPLYFNTVKKMPYDKFIVSLRKLTSAVGYAVHATNPNYFLDMTFCSMYDNGKWVYPTMYDKFLKEMYLRFGFSDSKETEGLENHKKILFEKYVREQLGTFADRVKNVGSLIARKKYGLDMEVVYTELMPKREYTVNETAAIYISLRKTPDSKEEYTSDDIADLFLECVLYQINHVFLELVFLTTVMSIDFKYTYNEKLWRPTELKNVRTPQGDRIEISDVSYLPDHKGQYLFSFNPVTNKFRRFSLWLCDAEGNLLGEPNPNAQLTIDVKNFVKRAIEVAR